MKRPNPILYGTIGLLVKGFAFIKGQRITKNVSIKKPAILLSNHTSFYDFIYTIAAVYPHRITFLAADKMFYDPLLGFFLKLGRAIPKCLFQSDPIATMNAFRILRQNGIVSIFPEGQISAIGKTQLPEFAIAKFLKKAKVDVYIVKHQNAYFVNPPWTKKSFRGRFETIKELILTGSNLQSMSEQDIYAKVLEKLAYNAAEYNKVKQYQYKLNDISNLENVLYHCPNCGHDGLVAQQYLLHCPSCQKDYPYDRLGRVGGYGVDELYAAQEKIIQSQINDSSEFELSGNVILQCFREKRLVNVGRGVLTLNQNEYLYHGTVDSVETDLRFSPANVPYLPSDIGRNIQIYQGYQIYQFEFEDKKLPQMFVHAGEYLYALANSKKTI